MTLTIFLILVAMSLRSPRCAASGDQSTLGKASALEPPAVADLYYPTPAELKVLHKTITNRVWYSLTPLLNGKVLVVGGVPGIIEGGFIYPGSGLTLRTAEVYNPTDGSFTPSANNMALPRNNPEAVLLRSGKVLSVGGLHIAKTYYGEWGPNDVSETLRSAELYEPSTGKFVDTGSMAYPRLRPEARLLQDGKVLITDGFDKACGRGEQPAIISEIPAKEIYDPLTGKSHSEIFDLKSNSFRFP